MVCRRGRLATSPSRSGLLTHPHAAIVLTPSTRAMARSDIPARAISRALLLAESKNLMRTSDSGLDGPTFRPYLLFDALIFETLFSDLI